MMKTLLAAALIVAGTIPMMAHANTYYVSTSGKDSNSGSSSSPWQHCPGMNGWNGSASLKAGDTVYFNSADTWTFSSGSHALSVVGGVTYDGRTWGGGTRAKFDVVSNLSGKIIIRFNADDQSYETAMIGFDFDGNNHEVTGLGFGRFYQGSLLGTTKRVEDCLIHHCGNANESGYNYGIFTGPSGGNTHRNIQVINCVIHDTGRSALCNYVNRLVENNVSYNVLFRGNEVYNSGLNTSGSVGIGILLKDHSEDTVVEYNYVHDCRVGIMLDAVSPHIGPMNAIVRYNLVTRTTDNAAFSIIGSGPKSCEMYGNIAYNNNHYGFLLGNNNSDDFSAKIYNNTFFNNCLTSGAAEIYLNNRSGTITFDIRNNIIAPKSGVKCIVDSNGSYITAHNNNLLYRADGGTLVTKGGSSYSASNISSWEATAQTANPSFKNVNNLPAGFTGTYGTDLIPSTDGLLPTQAAVGSGATLETKYSGAINLTGPDYGSVRQTPWDIGAYAIAGATTPTAPAPDTEAPATPANLTAAVASSSQINLSWSASTDNTGVSEYRIYRGGTNLATSASTSYSDSGLTESTAYTYTVSARDAAGNESAQSQPASATTISSSDMISSTEWQNRSIASQSGSFVIEYDAIPSGSNIDGVFGLSLGNATTWSDQAVTARFYTSGYIDARNGGAYTADTQVSYSGGSTYHFRIVVDVPNHVFSVYVQPPGGSEVVVAKNYAFRTGQEGVARLDTISTYTGQGSNQVLNISVSPIAAPLADTEPPSTPAGLTATAESSSQINLSWSASTDNTGVVTGYKVYRGGSLLAQTSSPSYSDSGLADSTTYTYTVSAVDAAGNESAQSQPESATTIMLSAPQDTQAPTVPANLAASVVSASQINLSWSASTDDTGVAGYTVYRGGSLQAQTTSTSYSDTGLAESTAYTYTVSAVDAAGNVSAESTSVSATTLSSMVVPKAPEGLIVTNVIETTP